MTVLPDYSTPETGVSAALCCLLQPRRTTILKALFELQPELVSSYRIDRALFTRLAMHPKESNPNADARGVEMIGLRLASMYLGNLATFAFLNSVLPLDDGLLNLAALLALPKFVQLLVQTHNPNLKEEMFDFWIPLALVCRAQPQPWCKFANEESTFRARRRKTMQILARVTDLEWRFRRQTVLHIAIETGVDIAEDMIDALDLQNDPHKASRYNYIDKGGQEFSLQEYVKELLDASEAEKDALLSRLSDSGVRQP